VNWLKSICYYKLTHETLQFSHQISYKAAQRYCRLHVQKEGHHLTYVCSISPSADALKIALVPATVLSSSRTAVYHCKLGQNISSPRERPSPLTPTPVPPHTHFYTSKSNGFKTLNFYLRLPL